MTSMLTQTVKEQIDRFVVNSPYNATPDLGGTHVSDASVVGVARADDPLWEKLKEPDVVGPHHLAPKQWLAGAKSVVSYFLPLSEPIRSSNRGPDPSAAWVHSRYSCEILVCAVRNFLIDTFEAEGARVIAPYFDRRFADPNWRANWSERHVAFVAGVGTLSLNGSLITRVGSAGRIGSVITDMELEPTVRHYQDFDEYCTKCGACISRCPPAALTERGRDNLLCLGQIKENRRLTEGCVQCQPFPHCENPSCPTKQSLAAGCGKCQAGVPCESGIPSRSAAPTPLPQTNA